MHSGEICYIMTVICSEPSYHLPLEGGCPKGRGAEPGKRWFNRTTMGSVSPQADFYFMREPTPTRFARLPLPKEEAGETLSNPLNR